MFLAFFWLMLWLALSGLSLPLLSLLVSCLLATVGAVVIVVGMLVLGHVDLAICVDSVILLLVVVVVVIPAVVVVVYSWCGSSSSWCCLCVWGGALVVSSVVRWW